MGPGDVDRCAFLVFDTFDFVLKGFVLDEKLCNEEIRLKYRTANVRFQTAHRNLQIKVARERSGDRRIVGISAYKVVNDDAPTASTTSPPEAPAGLDKERWFNFAAKEDDYAEMMYGKAARCDLWFLIVTKEYQGTGLGKRLFEAYVRGANGLPLFLVSSPTAVTFYQRIGFKVVEQAAEDGGMNIKRKHDTSPPQPGELVWPMYRPSPASH